MKSPMLVPKQHRTPIVWEQKRKQHQTSKVEDTDEEVITSSRNRNKIVDSDASTKEEVEPIPLRYTSSRIRTPRMIQPALLATSRDRHDSGNDSNMDRLNGTLVRVPWLKLPISVSNHIFFVKLFQESSRKSGDKRFSPPKTLAEEVSIHDLSNSILEVSSTVPSFSSPEV